MIWAKKYSANRQAAFFCWKYSGLRSLSENRRAFGMPSYLQPCTEGALILKIFATSVVPPKASMISHASGFNGFSMMLIYVKFRYR